MAVASLRCHTQVALLVREAKKLLVKRRKGKRMALDPTATKANPQRTTTHRFLCGVRFSRYMKQRVEGQCHAQSC